MGLQLSAFVITYNEQCLLPQCLDYLTSLTEDVVVLDSNSTDATPQIARSYPDVRFYQRPMPRRFADQRNLAAALCRGKWLLMLDADELLHPDFKRVLPSLLEDERYQAYSFPRLALLKDGQTYIDLTAVIPGEWDPQIRLYRKGLQWIHEDNGGLHEGLRINGRLAASHPCCVPPEVRYVHYPVLHYQLLKNDADLVEKAACFLERQCWTKETGITVDDGWVQKDSDGRIVVSDEEFWVRRKQTQYPLRDLATWRSSFALPPESDHQRLTWLYDIDHRLDEWIEYSGMTRLQTESLFRTSASAGPVKQIEITKETSSRKGVLQQSFKNWQSYIVGRIYGWIHDNVYRHHVRATIESLSDAHSVLVYADGIGDLSLELALRGFPEVTYAEVEGPAKRFFEWRLKQYGLQDRIRMVTLTGEPAIRGKYDAVVGLEWQAQDTINGQWEDFVGSLTNTTERLILPGADTETTSPDPGSRVGSIAALLRQYRWDTVDGFSWFHRHNLRFNRRPLTGQKRLLVPLTHHAWTYNLAHLDHQIEILPTPAWPRWESWVRPLRRNMKVIPIDLWRYPEASRPHALNVHPFSYSDWDCALIQHHDDIPVLMDSGMPLVFTPHSLPDTPEAVERLHSHRDRIGAAIFTSIQKRDAWGFGDDATLLSNSIDTAAFEGYSGTLSQCLAVCNSYLTAEDGMAANRLKQITEGIPILICDQAIMEKEDCTYERVKYYYRTRRVYVHAMEDRATMSLMEAMCTGMPAVIYRSRDSTALDPFDDGVNCYISDDLNYLHERTKELLADQKLCRTIGDAGRETILQRYDLKAWLQAWDNIVQSVSNS